MRTPLVSIIIPTYNRAHLIGETLESVLAQTYTNWECIVVDDGSTDNTDELLKTYCDKDDRIQYHHRPKDRLPGGNAARNYGFELSEGEFVQWFDDDDIMLQDFLKNKIVVLTKELDLVICSGYEVDQHLNIKRTIKLKKKDELFKEYVLWKLQVLTPSILFRKSFLRNEDLFSYKIFRGQETELFSRLFFNLKANSYKIINKPLFLYRQHSETKTSKNKKYIKEYKESQRVINLDNFKRGLQLKDKEIIDYLYKSLIKMLFLGFKNDHISNSKKILYQLTKILKGNNKKLVTELFVIINVCFLLKKSSYKIEKYFENYEIDYY